ncbi:MAG: hypothetical protein M0Z69_00535, partial [Actinomycetota bacterium]|nr:hypothetical protein [Actinomycetota bacterium]
MSYRPSTDKLPGPVRKNVIPVDAFNPLLRSLLTWDLVQRVEDEAGASRWELTAAAQQRLEQLNPSARRPATSLAYLDHWCARCRQQRLTHLRDGRYLCEDCERIETDGNAPPPAPEHQRPSASELAGA